MNQIMHWRFNFYTYMFASLMILCLMDFAAFAGDPSLPSPDLLKYPPLQFSIPKAEHTTLKNGIILYSLEDRELSLVDVSVIVRMGSVNDPENMAGLAELTGRTMRTGGVDGMTGAAVDAALDRIAAELSISVNQDHASFHMSLMRKDLEAGLDLLSKIITSPAFEEGRVKLEKDLKIEDIHRIVDDPQHLCFREFGRLFYPYDPRGNISTLSSIASIQREDIRNFYRKFFFPGNMMMAVTGDISSAESAAAIGKYFESWHANGIQPAILSTPKPPPNGLYFILKDVPQAIIISGRLSPPKAEADSYAFEILNFILGGGGFRSRIFQEIRSNRGLAYSTGSSYNARRTYGLFATYAFTKAASTAEVLSLMKSILADARKEPARKSEIQYSKESIRNSFIFSFTTAGQIAGQELMVHFDGLPEDYLEKYRYRMENVTVDDIKEAARRYLADNQNVLTVVLGPEQVYQDLQKQFGHIERIEPKL